MGVMVPLSVYLCYSLMKLSTLTGGRLQWVPYEAEEERAGQPVFYKCQNEPPCYSGQPHIFLSL